jgi:hypothetical protein
MTAHAGALRVQPPAWQHDVHISVIGIQPLQAAQARGGA